MNRRLVSVGGSASLLGSPQGASRHAQLVDTARSPISALDGGLDLSTTGCPVTSTLDLRRLPACVCLLISGMAALFGQEKEIFDVPYEIDPPRHKHPASGHNRHFYFSTRASAPTSQVGSLKQLHYE